MLHAAHGSRQAHVHPLPTAFGGPGSTLARRSILFIVFLFILGKQLIRSKKKIIRRRFSNESAFFCKNIKDRHVSTGDAQYVPYGTPHRFCFPRPRPCSRNSRICGQLSCAAIGICVRAYVDGWRRNDDPIGRGDDRRTDVSKPNHLLQIVRRKHELRCGCEHEQ